MALVLTGPGCGGDDDDGPTPAVTTENARSDAPDLGRFLMRNGEEPGFRRDGDDFTIEGVGAFADYARLSRAEARELRQNEFISFTTVRTLAGRKGAGVSEMRLFATPEGARNETTYELRASTIHALLPKTEVHRFKVRGVPGGRGWTGSDLHGNPIGTVQWVQGRCMLVLVSEGEVSFVKVLSTGARAIYKRTGGDCP